MAHSNGRIYIDPNTTGVEIADLQQVLGRGTGDLGLLCSDQEWYLDHIDPVTQEPVYLLRPVNRINKWAKYKPVKQSGLDFASQRNADFTWKDTANWWKAYNEQCGLTFDTYESIGANTIATTGFFHDLLAGLLSWGYEPPTGGINQYPFRMFDFLQYDHNAPKPVTGVFDNLQLYGGGKLTVQLDTAKDSNGFGIEPKDLVINNSAVSGWYVGILIWKSNSLFSYAFSDDTIGNGADSVEFTGMTNFQGSVTIVPFLSSVRWNQGGAVLSGTFISCDVAPAQVTIAAEQQHSVTMTIDAHWTGNLHGRVEYVVNIINNTGSQISVNNFKVSLYDGYQSIDNPVKNITIPAGDPHEERGVFIVQTYDASLTYEVVVASSRTEVNGRKEVDEPRNS